jgi:hypothetical protein
LAHILEESPMFRGTIIAFAAAAVVALGAVALSSSSALAYRGDYERYCYYHRYDPACWRYWHAHEHYDEDYWRHRHHDYDHDHDHDHDHHHEHGGDHDHDHH